jgi:hypothetical protein
MGRLHSPLNPLGRAHAGRIAGLAGPHGVDGVFTSPEGPSPGGGQVRLAVPRRRELPGRPARSLPLGSVLVVDPAADEVRAVGGPGG